jgi:hypothetical protein
MRTNIEHELDALVQKWAATQRSVYSGKRGCVGHHIYSRKNKMLRWDLLNIAPLTPEEHQLLHAGKIHLEINCKTQNYLDEMMRTDYRTWLIIHGMTEKEFFKKKREELRSCV